MQQVILSPISLEQFETLIRTCVKSELQNNQQSPAEQTVFLTRKETAAFLGICLPTLNEWTKRGLIPSYGIGTRIRYKKAEVESSLKSLQEQKHSRTK